MTPSEKVLGFMALVAVLTLCMEAFRDWWRRH